MANGARSTVQGLRYRVYGLREKLIGIPIFSDTSYETTVKSEPQNRRISNIECRRMESLRSVFYNLK